MTTSITELIAFGKTCWLDNREQDAISAFQTVAKHPSAGLAVLEQLIFTMLDLGILNDLSSILKAIPASMRRNLDFRLMLANQYSRANEYIKSIEVLRKITQEYPKFMEAWFNLAHDLERIGKYSNAFSAADRAFALAPHDPDVMLILSKVLLMENQSKKLDQVLNDWCRNNKPTPAILSNFAEAKRQLGDFVSAKKLIDAALHQDPESVALKYNRAVIIDAAGDYDDARAEMELVTKVIDNQTVKQKMATMFLRAYALQAGWHHWQWRESNLGTWVNGERRDPIDAAQIKGKSILVYAEQGLGDVVFFSRWIIPLLELALDVSIVCDSRLHPIFRRVTEFHLVRLIDRQELTFERMIESNRQDRRVCIPIGSLPAIFEVKFPSPVTLNAPDDLKILPSVKDGNRQSQFRIGVVWSAGTAPRSGLRTDLYLHKRIDPRTFGAALRNVNAEIIILQRNLDPKEKSEFESGLGRAAADYSVLNGNLRAMTAILDEVDDLIGVSCTNTHLRLALGKSATVIVDSPPDWRWGNYGSESPWYPNARIIRQHASTELSSAIYSIYSNYATP